MPLYKNTRDAAVIFPDISTEVEPFGTVELPDGFWVDNTQAAGAGFVPAKPAVKE